MSYEEFCKWINYYNKEPFAADRQEFQMAHLMQMVASFGGSKTKIKDFMVCKQEEKKQTVKEFEDDLKKRFAIFAVTKD